MHRMGLHNSNAAQHARSCTTGAPAESHTDGTIRACLAAVGAHRVPHAPAARGATTHGVGDSGLSSRMDGLMG